MEPFWKHLPKLIYINLLAKMAFCQMLSQCFDMLYLYLTHRPSIAHIKVISKKKIILKGENGANITICLQLLCEMRPRYPASAIPGPMESREYYMGFTVSKYFPTQGKTTVLLTYIIP